MSLKDLKVLIKKYVMSEFSLNKFTFDLVISFLNKLCNSRSRNFLRPYYVTYERLTIIHMYVTLKKGKNRLEFRGINLP